LTWNVWTYSSPTTSSASIDASDGHLEEAAK